MRNASIRIWNGSNWLSGDEIQEALRPILNLSVNSLDFFMTKLPKHLTASMCLAFFDKNNKCIYDGDIIRYYWGCDDDKQNYDDQSKYRTTLVEWDMEAFGFYPFNQYDEENDYCVVRDTVEIIGNRWENPELLK